MEPFDVKGLTPKEILEKIQVTYLQVVASAFAKGYEHGQYDGYEEGYKDGHKAGMEEAITTINE